jgi:hypothetical protein
MTTLDTARRFEQAHLAPKSVGVVLEAALLS